MARVKSSLEREFERAWQMAAPCDAPPPEAEHRFAAPRRWRFDYAWPEQRVAVELEGGVWIGGRHTRGAGFLGDVEKYNAAVLGGWRVLRFTANDLRREPRECVAKVLALLVREVA